MAKETFESQMKKLEDIVDEIEKNDTGLDTSLLLYEQGLQLAKKLKNELSKYENKINELNKDNHNEQ